MSLLGATLPYTAPAWTPSTVRLIPKHRISLVACTPTPIQAVRLPGLPESCPAIYIKRDDCTGSIEMSGNKTRKLEFLLADAQEKGCDCVVTAGGTQSNHCRCTTACARTVGMPSHLVLRDDFHDEGGNYFLNQLFGAKMLELDRDTYTKGGGFDPFMKKMAEGLEKEGKKPYLIDVGGSNPLGCWGYIQAFDEFVTQQMEPLEKALGGAPFTDIVCTTGSGSTLAGLGVAAKWYNEHPDFGGKREIPISVHGYGVCDKPDFFYKMAGSLCEGLYLAPGEEKKEGAPLNLGEPETWLDIRTARGLGYSKASTDELKFLNAVACGTGILFDRAYTNKAAFQMTRDLASGSFKPKGKVLFVHTGGGPSVFDQHEKIINCIGFDEEPCSPTNSPPGQKK